MSPPICTAVRPDKRTTSGVRPCTKPCRKVYGRKAPSRGWRVIDGVRWTWFCSQRCSGLTAGRSNVASGRWRASIQRAHEVLTRKADQRTYNLVADDARELMRYGVPKHIAVAILTRVARQIRQQTYEATYHRLMLRQRQQERRAAHRAGSAAE